MNEVIYTGWADMKLAPDLSIDMDRQSRTFGWLLAKHPGGQWVTLADLKPFAARIQAALNAAGGHDATSRSYAPVAAQAAPSAQQIAAGVAELQRFAASEEADIVRRVYEAMRGAAPAQEPSEALKLANGLVNYLLWLEKYKGADPLATENAREVAQALSEPPDVHGEPDEGVLARHSGKTERREWHSVGTWLYPGDEIVERKAKP